MPQKVIIASANISTGAWLQLDSTCSGECKCIFYNESQAVEIVTNAVDVTAAGAERTANRYFKRPAGGIVSPVEYRFDPARTWIRSATATASNINVFMTW